MQQPTSSTMFGFHMSPQCKQEWINSQNQFKNKKLETTNLTNIALFILEGLNSTNYDTKKRNIEQVVKSIASEMGVSLSSIKLISDPNSNLIGGYIRENNSMVLNLANLNNEVNFLLTIIHELRHAQQHNFMYQPNNEFASRIKYGITHYTKPSEKLIKNAQYFSNIVEVDAELTSYTFTKNILDQLKNHPKFKSHSEFIQKVTNSQQDYQIAEKSFQDQLNQSLSIVELSENARMAIQNTALAYSKQLLSPENRNNSKTTKESSEAVVLKLNELINSTGGKQITDFSSADLYLLKAKMFEGVSSHDIIKHLDDPFLQYIAQLEEKYEVVAASKYEYFVHNLKTEIMKPIEEFLKRNNIKYTQGDYPSMLKSYFDSYQEITIQNLLKGQEVRHENILNYLSFMCTDLKPQISELTDPSTYLKKIPLEIIQERAEESVLNKTYSAASWILPEFTEVCKEQANKNMFGKYFTALNIPESEWATYSTAQALEILKSTAPKYIVQHLLDDNISKFNESIIDFCLKFGDVSVERLHKELSTHPILKLKLKTMQKEKPEDLPDMVSKLQWSGRPLRYILDPSKKKKDEPSLS